MYGQCQVGTAKRWGEGGGGDGGERSSVRTVSGRNSKGMGGGERCEHQKGSIEGGGGEERVGKEGGEGGWEVLKSCRTEGDVCARSYNGGVG